jgi:uncharacterized peroxidase-related enzyme
VDDHHFLAEPVHTAAAQAMYDEDLEDPGFVMNVSRLWAHQPETVNALFALMSTSLANQGLTFRQRGILVTSCASELGDSYCSLAWGAKLAGASDDETAAASLRGDWDQLGEQERALARWARLVARDPNGTTMGDVDELRRAGFTDGQVFAITVFVALRLAFSTVNDALGARPDAELRATTPQAVFDAVSYGRPISEQPG